jgi:predicted amino acid-binding ACT domain protein
LSFKFVVAVMSRDRIGIVRDVTAVLCPFKANIERVSQTVVMNYFTLTFIVSFPQEHRVEEIRTLLESAGGPGEFDISVKSFEPAAEHELVVVDADCFVLTVTGKDRAGIINTIVTYLSGKGINIIDLYAYKPDAETFIVISQLSVPRRMNAVQIQLDIEAVGRKTGLSVTLQHENIFKATNEITAPGIFF